MDEEARESVAGLDFLKTFFWVGETDGSSCCHRGVKCAVCERGLVKIALDLVIGVLS